MSEVWTVQLAHASTSDASEF